MRIDYTLWFELVDEHGLAFSLIFGTRNRRGLEKMKEALWRVDPVRGIHFRDPRDPAQLTFDVGEKPQTASLANLLARHIDVGKSMLVEDLRRWTLEHTAFLPKHAIAVLYDWRTAGRLRVEGGGRLTRSKNVTLIDPGDATRAKDPIEDRLF